MRTIVAIDPGSTQSAVVVMTPEYKILEHCKAINKNVLEMLLHQYDPANTQIVCEMIASYGMPVGAEVFETCVWIGRFWQTAERMHIPFYRLYRQEEKLNLCHSTRARDSNIRQALIDRFAAHDLKNGKGTKKNPDFFYGFRADEWAAAAVAVTFLDGHKEEIKHDE